MARKRVLYIEDNCIKLLVTSGNKVESWATYDLEPGLVDKGMVLDTTAVANIIDEFLKVQNINGRQVHVALSGINSLFRIITIPGVSAKLLAEAVRNEARRELPVSLDEVYYKYQILPAEQKNEIKLFLAAYPRVTTDALLETIKKARLTAKVIELAPLALARCINAERAVAVNAWLTYLDIVILVNRIPLVMRSLSLPVESTSPAERLPAIRDEIRRTIAFFNSSFPDKIIDSTTPIMVCGDLALDEESLSYFGQMGYPVSLLSPDIQSEAAFNPSQQMVNLGVAIKDTLPRGATALYSIIDLNVIPDAYKPAPFKWINVLVPVGVAVAVGALYVGGLAIDDARQAAAAKEQQLQSVQLENARLLEEINALKTELAGVEGDIGILDGQSVDIAAKIKTLNDNIAFFDDTYNKLGEDSNRTNAGLAAAIDAIPEGMLVTGIDFEISGATLEGKAESEAIVLEYARLLRQNGYFQSVTLESMQKMETGSEAGELAVTFTLAATWSNP